MRKSIVSCKLFTHTRYGNLKPKVLIIDYSFVHSFKILFFRCIYNFYYLKSINNKKILHINIQNKYVY